MAIPTQPTAESICTEALKRKLNGGTPTTEEVVRATEFGMDKVKADIMILNKCWLPLFKQGYVTNEKYNSVIQLPTDLSHLVQVNWLKYSDFGYLTEVLNSQRSFTLSTEPATDPSGKLLVVEDYFHPPLSQGRQIVISSGEEVYTSYPFDVSPGVKDFYFIIDTTTPLFGLPLTSNTFNDISHGDPSRYMDMGSFIEIDSSPSYKACVGFKYYADLSLVDITSLLYKNILRKWYGVFLQGVYCWSLGEDDDRYAIESQKYSTQLMNLKGRDGFLTNTVSTLSRSVGQV